MDRAGRSQGGGIVSPRIRADARQVSSIYYMRVCTHVVHIKKHYRKQTRCKQVNSLMIHNIARALDSRHDDVSYFGAYVSDYHVMTIT